MTDPVQAFRARVITLCCNVMDACELTDLGTIKCQASILLEEMGVTQNAEENCEDLL